MHREESRAHYSAACELSLTAISAPPSPARRDLFSSRQLTFFRTRSLPEQPLRQLALLLGTCKAMQIRGAGGFSLAPVPASTHPLFSRTLQRTENRFKIPGDFFFLLFRDRSWAGCEKVVRARREEPVADLVPGTEVSGREERPGLALTAEWVTRGGRPIGSSLREEILKPQEYTLVRYLLTARRFRKLGSSCRGYFCFPQTESIPTTTPSSGNLQNYSNEVPLLGA